MKLKLQQNPSAVSTFKKPSAVEACAFFSFMIIFESLIKYKCTIFWEIKIVITVLKTSGERNHDFDRR